MISQILDYFGSILDDLGKKNKSTGINVSINNKKMVVNGNMVDQEELNIMGKTLKFEKDFKIEISYDGNIEKIETKMGSISVTNNNSDIKSIKTSMGDIQIEGGYDNTIGEISTDMGDLMISSSAKGESKFAIGKVSSKQGSITFSGAEIESIEQVETSIGDITFKSPVKNVGNVKSVNGSIKL